MSLELAGCLLLFALIFAPWCWACTWPAGIHFLNLMLLTATALWLVNGVREVHRLPPLLLVALAGILVEGWAMTLNSHSLRASASGLFAPLEPPMTGWPGSIERELSWETMSRLTGILGAALVATSLGRSHLWRERFARTMIATGSSIVLLGCGQRWTHASDIFWSSSRHLDYFFATYRNVTNAGEYLNLLVPMTAAAALSSVLENRNPGKKAFMICALALLIAGSFVSGSKIGPLLTLLLGILFVGWQHNEIGVLFSRSRLFPLLVLIGLVAFGLIIQGSGLDVTSNRWHRLFHDSSSAVTWENRWAMDRACFAAIPDAGLTGFGPGTFEALAPSLPGRADLSGIWLYAHDDYLQTWLEWGPAGAALWSGYFFGAIVALEKGLRQDHWRGGDRLFARGLLLALIGMALMISVDFPLQIASIQLYVAVLAGVGWSSLAWPRAVRTVGASMALSASVAKSTSVRGSRGNRAAVTLPAARAGR